MATPVDNLTVPLFEDVVASNATATFLKEREWISRVFARQAVNEQKFDVFRKALSDFIEEIQTGEAAGEHEAFFQSKIQNFFNAIGYQGHHNVAPAEHEDMAIHHEAVATSPVAAIIEVKRPSNVAEMCDENRMNVKALHEALAYEFDEVCRKGNIELQTLIVTNGWEWYFFNAKNIWQALTRHNNKYVNQYKKFCDGKLIKRDKDFLYAEVMAPAVRDLLATNQLECCHVSLKKLVDKKTGEIPATTKVRTLFRLFAPQTIVTQEVTNDSNALNRDFYNELLYIIGLEEVKDKVDGQDKLVIRRLSDKPKAKNRRQYHSLLESGLRLASYSHPGKTAEELFEPVLEVCLQWVDRIIFLKLLETQLVSYHDGDRKYKFLSPERFRTFDEMADLFFGVLAVPRADRNPQLRGREDFDLIPYLNSSLFEITEKEREYVRVGEVKDGKMKPYSKTVLVSSDGKPLTEDVSNLSYLLRFLDSYDFGTTSKTDANSGINKPLINASVLGMIFEKINGYKDGSVFTPGYITSAMCKKTLQSIVTKKLNKVFDWECQSWSDVLNACREEIRYKTVTRRQISEVIDSIKICDPAVGSGHFLVSALNGLIEIKDELRVLLDEDGNCLDATIICPEDELIVEDSRGNPYEYRYGSAQNAVIQKTLFQQKQRIIENCLFGVDLNPKSVQICRLRLWTELLKNAYYNEDGELQTLPNIDINIREGNSLVSLIPVKVGSSVEEASKEIQEIVSRYKTLVSEYKVMPNKVRKHELAEEIAQVRRRFSTMSYGQEDFFIESAGRVGHGFEWMVEFPEVLNKDGVFQGFDGVLANPPYMRVQGLTKSSPKAKAYYDCHYQVAAGSYDLANLFIERAMQISAPTAENAFIFPHKFLNSESGNKLRNYLWEGKYVSSLIHFGANQIFDGVTTYTCILGFSPQRSDDIQFQFVNYHGDCKRALHQRSSNIVTYKTLQDASVLYEGKQWILFPEKKDEAIFKKIYENSIRLGSVVNIYVGLQTSCDDLYILDRVGENRYRVPLTGEEFSLEKDFVKPYIRGKDVTRFDRVVPTKYLFFPYVLKNGQVQSVELDTFKTVYPLTYTYLMHFENSFKKRESGKAGKMKHWWEYIYPKSLLKHDIERVSSMEICSKHPSLALNNGIYHGTKVYSWLINDEAKSEINNKYLLAIGNSKLLWWFLKLTGDTLSGDARTMKTNYLAPFPLPKNPDPMIKSELEALVDRRLEASSAEEKAEIEAEIDSKVCDLYGLFYPLKDRVLENSL